MRITFETTQLASPDLALGRVPFGLTLNGEQIVDDAQFFRAAAASVFARGNLGTVLQFSVTRLFSTEKAAEVFALTHAGAVPLEGLVTAVCGETGDQQTVYLEGAVLQAVAVQSVRGSSVVVQYTIRGGIWTTDVPDEIPGESEASEDFIVMRRAKVPVAAAVDEVVVVFSAPLAAAPVVKAELYGPTGSAAIGGQVLIDTITVNGFTYKCDAETPNDDYELHYIAVE